MAHAGTIIEQYLSALYAGQYETARQYLTDDLVFSGPAASFASADTYLRATHHAVRAVARIETHKIFVDGSDAAAFYDLHFTDPERSVPIADWYRMDGGKIASIRTILDTGPLMSSASAGETAVDPVCGMTVAKASAAATRDYASETYYFCNVGCAEAFDAQPAQYAAAVSTS